LFTETKTASIGPVTVIAPTPGSLDTILFAIAVAAAILVFWAKRGMFTVIGTTAALGLAAKMLTS
jgi:chromate transporter